MTTLGIDTVTRTAYQGESAYGPVYSSTATTVPGCYVERGYRRVVDAQGEETVASCTVYAPGTSTWASGDRVTIDGATYRVIDAQPMRTPRSSAVHHWEVVLQGVA